MSQRVAVKLNLFFNNYPLKTFPKKHILIQGGDTPRGIFRIESGVVRQYDINSKGNEIVVNVFKPPAFFPMSWGINESHNDYFFETSEESKVRIAPREDVIKFIKENGDVMFDLISRVYRGVDGLQRRMALLMGGSSRNRVVFELIVETRRFGEIQSDGTYLIRIHEDELAKRAGLSRESVNRQIKLLGEGRIVKANRTGIIVNDLRWLENELSGL